MGNAGFIPSTIVKGVVVGFRIGEGVGGLGLIRDCSVQGVGFSV